MLAVTYGVNHRDNRPCGSLQFDELQTEKEWASVTNVWRIILER